MKKLLALVLFLFATAAPAQTDVPKLPDHILNMTALDVGDGYSLIATKDLQILVEEVIARYRELEKQKKGVCL